MINDSGPESHILPQFLYYFLGVEHFLRFTSIWSVKLSLLEYRFELVISVMPIQSNISQYKPHADTDLSPRKMFLITHDHASPNSTSNSNQLELA